MNTYSEVTSTTHPVGGLRFHMELDNGHGDVMNARYILKAMDIHPDNYEFDSGMCHTSIKVLSGDLEGKWFDVQSEQIGNDRCIVTLLEDK